MGRCAIITGTMGSRPSYALVMAMRAVKAGTPAHAAAKRWGLAISTIYRSAEYRAWKGLPPYNRWKPDRPTPDRE